MAWICNGFRVFTAVNRNNDLKIDGGCVISFTPMQMHNPKPADRSADYADSLSLFMPYLPREMIAEWAHALQAFSSVRMPSIDLQSFPSFYDPKRAVEIRDVIGAIKKSLDGLGVQIIEQPDAGQIDTGCIAFRWPEGHHGAAVAAVREIIRWEPRSIPAVPVRRSANGGVLVVEGGMTPAGAEVLAL